MQNQSRRNHAEMPSIVTSALALCIFAAAQSTSADPPESGDAVISPRVLHHFDFDERAKGNLESLPKYWVPLPHPDFPNFASAGFDFSVGRSGPPSFYIDGAGRDAACIYSGPDTRVQPGISYRIEGYVRPNRLEHARTCLSAVYLDRGGRALIDTQVRSPLARVPDFRPDRVEWLPLELYLPPAPPEAHTVGLIAWVLQEATWDTSAKARRNVLHIDVHGGAWFDDITVFALPRFDFGLEVETAGRFELSRSNVIPEDAKARLRFATSDRDIDDLSLEVVVVNAAQEIVRLKEFAGSGAMSGAEVAIHDLPPGWYEARLEVRSGKRRILGRDLQVVRLAPSLAMTGERGEFGPRQRSATGVRQGRGSSYFGLDLFEGDAVDAPMHRELIQHQGVGALTVPVWPGLGDEIDVSRRKPQRELIQELARDGYNLTAVLAQPPREISETYGAYTRSVLDLLADDPSGWQPLLAAVAAPFASAFRSWQIGASDEVEVSVQDVQAKAVAQVRAALDSYVLNPRLTRTIRSSDFTQSTSQVENVRLRLEAHLAPEDIRAAIGSAREQGYEQVAVLVPPLDRYAYARWPRLADWAKRLIIARHAGADVVYSPQTWTLGHDQGQRMAAPTEDYIVLRTLAEALAEVSPGPVLTLQGGTTALTFYSGEQAVLAVWNDEAGDQPRPIAVSCGALSSVVDLWGCKRPVNRDRHGRALLEISSTPVLVIGAERAVVDLGASMRLAPPAADIRSDQLHASIEWTWTGSATITGTCEIVAPPQWDIVPRSIRFALAPQKTERFPLTMRHPHNESVGIKELLAQCRTDDDRYLEIPLHLQLRFPGIEVQATAIIEGRNLILRQTVRNVGASPFHLRGAAAVPGRERQYRPFTNLLPGEVQAAEYRFANAGDLIGRRAMLTLRELNDGVAMHTLELQIP